MTAPFQRHSPHVKLTEAQQAELARGFGDEPVTKGTRVGYTVMYDTKPNTRYVTEFGRITRVWPPDAPAMCRIAVEDPQPGRARYITRKLRDVEPAPTPLSAALTSQRNHRFADRELLNITRQGLSRIYMAPPDEASEDMREAARQALARFEGLISLPASQGT